MVLDELPAALLRMKSVKTVDEIEFKKMPKSKKVLVKPEAIAKFLSYAASNHSREIASLLIGRLEGEYLVILDVRHCKKSKGTASSVEISPEDMSEISESLDRGSFVVGWAHSHPNFGTFMSSLDREVQGDFQNLFSDSIALVLDPFKNGKIEFNFYRLVDGEVKEIEYAFLVRNENEAL